MNVRAVHLVLIAAIGCVAGCGGDAPRGAAADAAPGAAAEAQAAAGAPPEALAAVPLGSGSAPVQLGFIVTESPAVGRQSTVTFTVSSAEELERVEIRVSSKMVDVAPESATLVLAPLHAGQAAEYPVVISPRSAGLADLELQVIAKTEAGERQAQFAVPILAQAAAAGD